MARTKRKINPVQSTPAPEKQQRIYRAAGYIRLSVEDSGKPGADTIVMQSNLVQSYIENQPDMRFCGLFCDNGRTGTNFDRPAFERLMDQIRTGKIDCIVVKDLSRFGRNYWETGNYLERVFPLLDVRFIAINDNFDTLTAERTADGFIVPLKNIINASYSKDISRKIGSVLDAKQQRGEFIGTWAAYGYRKCPNDRHRIEPDEETAPIVKMIFELRVSGMAVGQIARKLNAMDIPSPSRYHYLKGDAKSERYANMVWHGQVIRQILTNEVYLGHMVQGRKRESLAQGQKQCALPKSEWKIVYNTHEPLIDEKTFQAVQTMAEQRRTEYFEHLGRYDSLGTTANILRGLVFCAECKRTLVRYKSVINGKKIFFTYICPSHAENPDSCPMVSFREPELLELLWDTLQLELLLADDLGKRLRQYQSSSVVMRREQSIQREIADARKALNRAKMLHDSLYQNYVDRLVSEREYMELKQQYRADMAQAQMKLDALEEQRQAESRQTEKNRWLTACEQFRGTEKLTEEMAHALIERVEIDADNHVSVMLRYKDECRALLRLLVGHGEAVSE